MSSGADRWVRAERLDAESVVEALQTETGVRLTVEGPCRGGQVGAAYVRRPDGHRSVLKWRPHSRIEEMRSGPLAVTEAVRLSGYPAPATELLAQVGQAVVTVQELLPGTTIDRLDDDLLDQALLLIERQAGLLAGRPEIPAVPLYLLADGPGFCLHEPLRQSGGRSAALERWVTEVGEAHPATLAGVDAVHLDFHPGNLLATGNVITGVIDWDGAGRGDRRLDLVTLRFGVHSPAVEQRLDAVLDALPGEVLRPLWAHLSLRLVDWAIRHHTLDDVDRWLDLAQQRIDQG